MAEAEEQKEMKRKEFEYDVAIFRKDMTLINWWVMEKGSKKSEFDQQYKLSLETINEAQQWIRINLPASKNIFSESPIYRNRGCTVHLKKEYSPLFSVKARGVAYTLSRLSNAQKRKGIVAASTGSFAYILCFYANRFETDVTVVMPRTISNTHFRKCEGTGPYATVILYGNNMTEAHDYAVKLAWNDGLFYLDGHDHPNMIIGQATLGVEIVDEMPGIDMVILPTLFPDCGLTAGIATAIKEKNSEIETIEVYPELYDKFVKETRDQTWYNSDSFPKTYLFSNFQRGTLFNAHYPINNESIFNAKTMLRVQEGIHDISSTLGLAWIKSAKKKFIKGKRIVIFSFGKMDSYMDYKLYTESQPAVPGAGPSTSHPFVPHAGPSTSRE